MGANPPPQPTALPRPNLHPLYTRHPARRAKSNAENKRGLPMGGRDADRANGAKGSAGRLLLGNFVFVEDNFVAAAAVRGAPEVLLVCQALDRLHVRVRACECTWRATQLTTKKSDTLQLLATSRGTLVK